MADLSVYNRPTTPNEACTHKQATHWHGTYACYGLDGCRCWDCRQAVHRYERERIKRLVGAVPATLVDAAPTRRRVRQLVAAGMSLKRIAKMSGVPHGALSKLVYGDPRRRQRPTRRIRRETAERIAACPYSVADGGMVPAAEARAIVDELVARGWLKKEIGRRITGNRTTASLQVFKGPGKGQRVRAGNLRILRRLLGEHPAHPRAGYEWRRVAASTPGVPAEKVEAPFRPAPPAGKLKCAVCGQLLAGHSLTAHARGVS